MPMLNKYMRATLRGATSLGGTQPKARSGYARRLTDAQAQQIKDDLAAGKTPRDIAFSRGVSYEQVVSIRRGETFKGNK